MSTCDTVHIWRPYTKKNVYVRSNPGSQLELGFRTYYSPMTGCEDDTAVCSHSALAAKIGVIGDTSTSMYGDSGEGGLAPNGHQYFALEDTNGFVHVEMDPVTVGQFTGLRHLLCSQD